MDLCEAAERKRREWVGIRSWEQARLDLAGARDMLTAAAEADENGLEE